jgi:succinyl-CoA synthetase beta subunit
VCFCVQKLVVKPDQLIKRRGKLGLIKVNADFPEVKSWVEERMGKDQKIGRATGKLRNFIIEPFIPHGEVRISIFLILQIMILLLRVNIRYKVCGFH